MNFILKKICLFILITFSSFSCKDIVFKNQELLVYYENAGKIYYYMESEELKDADVITFQILSGKVTTCTQSAYAKDKKNVYYRNKMILEADPDSFEIIGSNYSKDKDNIYYKGEKIKKADVTKETVEIRNGMCTNWDDSFCLLNGRKKFYKDREIKSWEDLHKKGFQF